MTVHEVTPAIDPGTLLALKMNGADLTPSAVDPASDGVYGEGFRTISLQIAPQCFGRPKEKDVIIAETESGKTIPVGPGRYSVTSRGGKGHPLAKRSKIARVATPEPPTSDNGPKLLN